MLTIPRELYATMVAHMIAGLPEEACGLLAGEPSGDRVRAWYPAGNAARSAKLYEVEPVDHLRADRDAQGQGWEIIGVAHSHTHTDAYPSPTDVAQAPDPGWHYVLVSLRHPDPVVRSFSIRDGVVEEEPVVVERTGSAPARRDPPRSGSPPSGPNPLPG